MGHVMVQGTNRKVASPDQETTLHRDWLSNRQQLVAPTKRPRSCPPLLTATGSSIGLASGYVAARLILGADELARAGSSRLIASSLLGSLGGFGATGAALYFTGRRRIR